MNQSKNVVQVVQEPTKTVAILFDVDGTLCNSCNLAFTNTNIILQKEGLDPVDMETYHYATRFSTPRRFAWHVTGDADDDSGVGQRLADIFDSTYVKLVSKETAGLFDGLYDALHSVKSKFQNLKYGAMTNGAGAFSRAVLLKNELADIFEFAFGADELPASKPSPLGLEKCMSFIDVTKEQSVYVGDSPTDGMAATAAGMISIGVTWGSYPKSELEGKFTYYVDTPAELARVMSDIVIEKSAASVNANTATVKMTNQVHNVVELPTVQAF